VSKLQWSLLNSKACFKLKPHNLKNTKQQTFKKYSCTGGHGITLPHRCFVCMVGRRGKTACCHLVPCSDTCSGFPGNSNCHPASPMTLGKVLLCYGLALCWLTAPPWPPLPVFPGQPQCCLAGLPSGSDRALPSGNFQVAWSHCPQGKATSAWPPWCFLLLFSSVRWATHCH